MEPRRRYIDIAEFGNSMHHLFDHLKSEAKRISELPGPYQNTFNSQEFGRNYLHWAKKELRDLNGCDNDQITERDVKVFALAMTMAQSVMANCYSRHAMDCLADNEIFPVKRTP